MNQKQQKPTLSGQRIRTRKRGNASNSDSYCKGAVGAMTTMTTRILLICIFYFA